MDVFGNTLSQENRDKLWSFPLVEQSIAWDGFPGQLISLNT